MTRLLILSDSHGNNTNIERIIKEYNNGFDIIFHLGDISSDIENYINKYRCYVVIGNIEHKDTSHFARYEIETVIESVNILATHGNRYQVKNGSVVLFDRAKETNADLVLFGHTHEQSLYQKDNITFFNPGALKNGDYGFITLENGVVIGVNHLKLRL